MYYPNYNPTLHDVYLYDPSNTGLPTGLNPNCILYDCRNCYKSISVRARAFTNLIKTVPPGTPTSLLANYYNTATPLFVVESDKKVSATIHYLANKPSDSNLFDSKYTGYSGPNPIGSINFWKNDFSGLTNYGPWTSVYNCVPYPMLGGTFFVSPRYFSGSPEVPGFSSGATFYRIAATDHGFMDLLPQEQEMVQTTMQHIHPYAILTQQQKDDLESFITSPVYDVLDSNDLIEYAVPVTDVYVWDGNDKVIPAEYIKFSFKTSPSPLDTLLYTNSLQQLSVLMENGTAIAVGDSSSQFLYKKGNTFYSFGHTTSFSTPTVDGITYAAAFGCAHAGSFLPTYVYLDDTGIDANKYRISNNSDVILATNNLFQNVNNLLDNIVSALQNKYNEFTG